MNMIEEQEGKILKAALGLSNKTIDEVMVKIQETYMLDINTVINREVT